MQFASAMGMIYLFRNNLGDISLICAYCATDKKATREHIIPKGIIFFQSVGLLMILIGI